MRIIINKMKRNQAGATALLMTMFILTGIFVISLAASRLVNNGLVLGKTQVNSTKAYFAAEAGAERILWKVRDINSDLDIETCGADKCFTFLVDNSVDSCNTDCEINPDPATSNQTQLLSNNSFYVIKYYTNPMFTEVSFTSKGSFQDVARAVEVKFSLIPEDCDDEFGIDEDGDGLANCLDHISCDGKNGNSEGDKCQAVESTCDDGFDNDADGAVDCADTDDCPAGTPPCP